MLLTKQLLAGPIDYLKAQYKSFGHSMESYKSYDFKSCKPYEANKTQDYYVRCIDDTLIKESNFDQLSDDIHAIKSDQIKDNFLTDLKKNVLKDLELSYPKLLDLHICIKMRIRSTKCEQQLKKYIRVIRHEVPKMRILMAQMDKSGFVYPSTGQKRISKKIQHPINATTAKDLSQQEKKFLEKHIHGENGLVDKFTQQVRREGKVKWLKRCLHATNPQKILIKETASCELFSLNVNTHINRKFARQNKVYRTEYNKLISANPILSLLKIRADKDESDEVLIKDLDAALEKLRSEGRAAVTHIKSLEGDDRNELLAYKPAVEKYLSNNSDPHLTCDIAQGLKDDLDFDDLKTELYLGAATIIGSGFCAYSFGLGCAVIVGVEAVGVGLSQNRLNKSQSAFYAGLTDHDTAYGREFDRNLALYLAPLALVGSGIGKTVKATVAARKLAKVEKNLNGVTTKQQGSKLQKESSSPVAEDDLARGRRYDSEQRKEVDDLNTELGADKAFLLSKYAADQVKDLSSADQTFLAGIAKMMEKKLLASHANINDPTLISKMKEELGKLIKECRGRQ